MFINIDLYREKTIWLNEHPSKIVYLCGVARPYKWENNFHLALLESEGETLEVAEHGIILTVENAIPLPITTDAMNAADHPKVNQKGYATCRNWQFAHFLNVTGILNPEQ